MIPFYTGYLKFQNDRWMNEEVRTKGSKAFREILCIVYTLMKTMYVSLSS